MSWLTGSVHTMTSTPSYPRRAAISKAVAVDSGYTEAVDSATFASGMRTTGSAMPTGYGVRWDGCGAPIRRCGVRHGRVGVVCGRSRRSPRPFGPLDRPHVVQAAQDDALPQGPGADLQAFHPEQVHGALGHQGAGEELARAALGDAGEFGPLGG